MMSFATYLQRLGDFALAQIFHPETASAAAAQVLLPVAAVPAAGRGADPHWVRVSEVITHLETAVAVAPVYELAEARLCRWLQHLIAPDWPLIWRDAVTVYVVATLGVELTDEAQLQALDQEAHAALWEAHKALSGPSSL